MTGPMSILSDGQIYSVGRGKNLLTINNPSIIWVVIVIIVLSIGLLHRTYCRPSCQVQRAKQKHHNDHEGNQAECEYTQAG